MNPSTITRHLATPGGAALVLRVGLAIVFITGGLWKLSRLVHPGHWEGIVAMYTSSHGYINAFFQSYLFEGALGAVLSPWGFLTALSTFELFAGLALLVGLLVRPLALIYMFLLWTFVIALPVHTVPEAVAEANTFEAPALLVQVRDVALSGLMAALFILGAGRWSIDGRIFGARATANSLDWEPLGLLTRLSIGLPLLVGGLFAVTGAVPTFSTHPLILALLGIALILGVGVRIAGGIVVAIMLWHIGGAFELGASLLDNVNGAKREFAFLAAGIVLAAIGGGGRFTPADLGRRYREYRDAARRAGSAAPAN